jgi:hypothetical protein
MDPRIADYIRANRKKFTHQAITDQLVAAGHDRAEVERTWAALEAPDPDAVAGEGFWGRFALIVVGINVGVLLLVGLLSGAFQQLAQGTVLFLVIFGVILAIGALISWGIVAATGPTKMGPRTAMIIGIAIPLVVALLIGGSCFALIGGLGAGLSGPPINGTMQVELGAPLDLMEELPATCQAEGPDPTAGWSVYANMAYEDGTFLDVSINSFPLQPGGPPQPSVYVSVMRPNEPERPLAWSSDAPGSGADLGDDAGFLQGTLSFDALTPMQDEFGNVDEPLSGEITWTCQ